MPMLGLRVALTDLLVDISRLDDLKEVPATPDSLWLGALTTHAAIEDGKLPDIFSGLMRSVAGQDLLSGGSQPRHHRRQRGACRSGRRLAVLLDRARRHVRISAGNGVRIAARSPTSSRDSLRDDAHHRRHHHGLRHSAPEAPLRWGFAKVARKSGAFANSIAIAVAHGKDGPVSVVLGAAAARAHLRCRRRRNNSEPVKARKKLLTLGDRQGPAAHVPRDDPYLKALAHVDRPARRAGDANPMKSLTVELNGVKLNDDVEPRETLADFLRDRCRLTATHLGCEHGACGACTVVVDGHSHPLLPSACSHVQRPFRANARRPG